MLARAEPQPRSFEGVILSADARTVEIRCHPERSDRASILIRASFALGGILARSRSRRTPIPRRTFSLGCHDPNLPHAPALSSPFKLLYYRRVIPSSAQVPPLRILLLNQRNLFLASPSLQLLLTRDRIGHFAERLVIEQTVNIIFGGKSSESVVPVLSYARAQIARDSNVQCPADATEDVYGVAVLAVRGHRFAWL